MKSRCLETAIPIVTDLVTLTTPSVAEFVYAANGGGSIVVANKFSHDVSVAP
jgi:hypothetical protein